MDVLIGESAQRDFDELTPSIQLRVAAVFVRLERWPKISGVKWLTGSWRGHARIRTGDYRVIVHPDGDKRIIVDRVAHRREVYE